MEKLTPQTLTPIFQACISETNDSVCPACGHRTTKEIILLNRPVTVRVMCECQQKEYDKQRAANEFKQKARKLERFKSYSLMDKNFADSVFENWQSVSPEDERILKLGKAYCRQWETVKAQNKGILLYGRPGNGKSFLSFCIANALYQENVAALAISSINILNRIKDSFDRSGSSHSGEIREMEIIHAICDASLLVLDDLGAEYKTAWTTEKLYSIIDTRYRSKKPLIITTNLSLEQLRVHLTDEDGVSRIYDRIMEMCAPIEVRGQSRRVQKAYDNANDLARILSLAEDES